MVEKEVLNLKHDMIQVPRHGRMEMVKEQRGTCWLADDDLTFEYSGKSMIPQKIPAVLNPGIRNSQLKDSFFIVNISKGKCQES